MSVYKAISQVMAKLSKEGISKDRKNQKQGYSFRGIDDVYNALASHLADAGLIILPRVLSRQVTERQTANGGTLFYVVLDVEFDLVSVEGDKHTIRVSGEAMDSGDKATNKAMSAAYKYACMQTFCIPTEGDNDADSQTHEVKYTADPRGDATADPKAVEDWCNSIADIVKNAGEQLPTKIFHAHLDLSENNDLYICVADELVNRKIVTKARWKELVKEGKGYGI